MKQKRNLLIAMILSAGLGWALGFLRLPYFEKNISFGLGLITGLAFVLLVVLILFVWNKNALLVKLIGKESTANDHDKAGKTHRLIWILVSLFVVAGGMGSSYMIFKQNEVLEEQAQQQQVRMAEQSELMASSRKSNMILLMNSLFSEMDEELRESPTRRLSEETIARVAALGYSFKPYSYWEGDHWSTKKLSPEKGQLLLVLAKLNTDSSSFASIKQQVSFAAADLQGADLEGTDLRRVDLKDANLKDANLSNANLQGADLREANCWGANLQQANLSGADLKRVNFEWANLDGANLRKADLDGVNMTSTKVRKADLSDADLQWANLSGALFNETKLINVNFFGSGLSKANLSNADMSDANFMRLDLTEVNLSGAEFSRASIEEKDWMEKLNEWRVTGAKEIQESYRMVDDTTGRTNYQLDKIKN